MIAAPRLSEREKEIISILKADPHGISLPEMAYILDVASLNLMRDVKKLLKKGLIKKRENRYFIIDQEE